MDIQKMKIGEFTNTVCPKCGEEHMQIALAGVFEPKLRNVLYCQNCHYTMEGK